MASKVKVKDNRRKYDEIIRNARKHKRGTFADVGIFESQGLDLVIYATANEFGLGPPERSFLRSTFDQHRRELIKRLNNEKINIVLARKDPERVLSFLGEFLISKIQQNIQSGIGPPNAPSTIAKKGSSKPLIDKARMIQSITKRIRKK
jgi:hypothetical protein